MNDRENLLRILGLIYAIGVNDGLREAVGRKKEQEGKDAALAIALGFMEKSGIRIVLPEPVE
jgi:hypothetical protein